MSKKHRKSLEIKFDIENRDSGGKRNGGTEISVDLALKPNSVVIKC